MTETSAAADPPPDRLKFQVFRFADASPDDGLPDMVYRPSPPAVAARAEEVAQAGMLEGAENRMLFSGGGFSLAYAWFKSGFPLPRHSHDSDCLYYIVGGSLQVGDQELNAGDGFFLGAGTPYAYTPGPEGVEVLEFRAAQSFDIRMLAGAGAFWDKALATVAEKREGWRRETRPSGLEG
jgi:hypothetical protein